MRAARKLLALALAGAMLLPGCTATPQQQPSAQVPTPVSSAPPVQTGVLSLAYDPQQPIHPITSPSPLNLQMSGLVYQGLYALDPHFQPQPQLAAQAQASESGWGWTVEVVQGVTFSDGTPLTATQVVQSLELARTSPRYQSRLAGVTGVRQTGEYTLELSLSAPHANLPALLDVPVVLERGEGTPPLGTGPYVIQGSALVRNPHATQAGELPVEQIPLVEVDSPNQCMAAFDSGQVWMTVTEFFSPSALGYSGSCEVWDYPTTQLLYLGFRTQGGACADEKLRQAISAALNRQDLVAQQLSGHGDPTALPISPVWGELPEVEQSSGEGKSATLKLVVNQDNPTRQRMAQDIAAQLGEIGLTVTVEALAWEDYVTALQRGNFDLYLGQVQLTADFDLTPLLTGSLAYGGWQGQVQQQLNQWRTTGEQEALQAYLTGFAQQMPLAPICFLRGSVLVRWGLVTGMAPTQANPYAQVEQWTVWSSVEEKNAANQEKE